MMEQEETLKSEVNSLFKALLSIIEPFTELLRKENSLITSKKMGEINKTLAKKVEFTEKLNQLKEQIAKINEPALYMNSKLLNDIKIANQQFEEELRLNEILLTSGIEVHNKIIEIQKSKLMEETVKLHGYNNKGIAEALNKVEKYIPPVNLNNKV